MCDELAGDLIPYVHNSRSMALAIRLLKKGDHFAYNSSCVVTDHEKRVAPTNKCSSHGAAIKPRYINFGM